MTQSEPPLLASLRASGQLTPLDTWMVESHQALHDVCRAGSAPGASNAAVTGLSYDLLREYREELMRALYGKVVTGVESPQAFAAYARSLKIAPSPAALLYSADILQAFVRDVFLTGNGTLFVNNTFVEWAAVQALRRAQPRMLVTRFGVRHKFRPFSSMLLFSQPRASDQSPLVEDPVGFVRRCRAAGLLRVAECGEGAGLSQSHAVSLSRRRCGRAAGDSAGCAGNRRAGAGKRHAR